MGSLDSECVNCKELWIARRKHQHLQTAWKDQRNEAPLKEIERETGGQKEREWGREDAVLYEKGG